MSTESDKFWKDVVGKLRKVKRLRPLTAGQAEAALDAARGSTLFNDEIDRIVEAVTSGVVPQAEPELNTSWMEIEQVGAEEEIFQLNRNRATVDADTERLLEQIRREELDKDGKQSEPEST